MDLHRFDAKLQVDEDNPTATFIEVLMDVRGVFGRARPAVRVTINGYTFRTTVAVYGGRYYLPVNRSNRTGADIAAGATVTVELGADDEPRVVEVPRELEDALGRNHEARSAFERLAYSHQKEYAEWVAGAKRAETRPARRQSNRTTHRAQPGEQSGVSIARVMLAILTTGIAATSFYILLAMRSHNAQRLPPRA